MGSKITVKQNDFSHGMQSETRNKNLVGQTQVFGASLVKNFDIYGDKNKLTPNPTFERFNTDAESLYKIISLGGDDGETVYGVGSGVTNWYNLGWDKRVLITPSSISDISYGIFDLSVLGADFWDNVSDDGSDIAFVDASNNESIQIVVNKFDKDAEEGIVMYEGGTLKNFYIYWDSQFSNPDMSLEGISTSSFFYTVMGEDYSGDFDLDPSANEVTPSDGIYGYQFKGNSDSDSNTYNSGDEFFTQFMFKLDNSATGNTSIDFPSGNGNVTISSTGALSATIDLDPGGSTVFNSSTNLTAGVWHHVQVTLKEANYVAIYLDGVEVNNTATGSSLDGGADQANTNFENGAIANLCIGRDRSLELSRMETEGLMHANLSTSFYTVGSTQLLSSITPTFGGHALYQKGIDDTEWTMYANNSNANTFPVPGFVVVTGGKWYYLTSDLELAGTPTHWNTFDTIDLFQSTEFNPTQQDFNVPYVSFPIDKEYYFATLGTVSNISSGTFNMDVYDPYPQPTSMVEYGYSLAMVGTRREQGYIEIWDTTILDPETVVRLGTGNAEVVANIKGGLITVIDNYIQNENLSKNEPSLDFRAWLGSDNVKNLQSFKYDVVDTVYPYPRFQKTINNVRADLNNFSTFYAEPNSTQTGMWAIGMTEKATNIAISIPYGVSNLARPLNYISKGNNLIVVDEDFDIWKLSSANYSETSTFETMTIDAGLPGIKKDIVGIEVVLDKTPSESQIITVSYQVDNGSFETIGTCTEKKTEFALANGSSFNNFDESKLRITSTGGDASVVEWSMKVEYEQEMV